MNSSHNNTLAIKNHCTSNSRAWTSKRLSLVLASLFILVNLQGCSTIEGIFDGSIFSDATPAPVKDVGEFDEKTQGSRDLRSTIEPEVKPLNSTTTKADKALASQAHTKSLEIMWQVPTEAVEAYHIYLISGLTESAGEDKHIRVPISKLKKEDDPTYGPIYRYKISSDLTVSTIQIRAENRFGLSEPSEPIVVQK